MNATRKICLATGMATALALGGCWGGGDDDAVAAGNGVAVPDSVGASAGAFLGYLLALASTDDSSEPSAIGAGFGSPTDETSEPQPLS